MVDGERAWITEAKPAAPGPTSTDGAVAAGAGQLGAEVRTGTGTFVGRRGEVLVTGLLRLSDGVGAVSENPGTLAGRLLPLVGIGAASAAVTGLAGGPDSPAVACWAACVWLPCTCSVRSRSGERAMLIGGE
ncbi:hypothetical protein PVAP13_6NG104235 [Panicum virgatum]|uniref:Uncharacterized protein n=1 Tax=Panicum virgatum TaxID=38727 RepID=A0A8T0QWB0_PANVG|nr:hypothetical protein PVAP13_6NG104235 [Panicum virgatum]